jgi:hypothetical protein
MPKKASKRTAKSVKSATDERPSSSKASLPTIPSAADLLAPDISFPARDILIKKEEKPGMKYRSGSSDQSDQESTVYASSSCVSDDDSLCSDGDSFWAPADETMSTSKNDKEAVIGITSPTPTSTKDGSAPLSTTPNASASAVALVPIKNHKPYEFALRTSACVLTVLCMVSPFSCGMAIARLVERMPVMPILWNLCLIAKQKNSRVHVPLASFIACFAGMVAPVPSGMAVARFVQHRPLVAMLGALCAMKGKRYTVDQICKISRASAYSLVVPSLIAPMFVGSCLLRLGRVLNVRPKTMASTALSCGAILYLAPQEEGEIEDEA